MFNFRDTIKTVAVSAVVSLAVSFGMLHATPATQAAQASISEPAAEQGPMTYGGAYFEDSKFLLERAGWKG